MTFDKLEKNLMDVIQEEQAKLGFRREKIRLYYLRLLIQQSMWKFSRIRIGY